MLSNRRNHDIIVTIGLLIDGHDRIGVSYADCVDDGCEICAKVRDLAVLHLHANIARRGRLPGEQNNAATYAKQRAREMNPETNSINLLGYAPEKYAEDRIRLKSDANLCAFYDFPRFAFACFKKIHGLHAPRHTKNPMTKAEYLRIRATCENDPECARKMHVSLNALRMNKRRWGLTEGGPAPCQRRQ